MKNLGAVAMLVAASASIPYFKYQRPVSANAAGQQYIVVDETIWGHARPDLGDLRLYAGSTEVPYTVITQQGGLEQDRQEVRVLQQATVGGKTQFLIDMSGLAEYDHVNLKLATRNFVAHAVTEGQDDPHAQRWNGLGDSILYDLSKENLGSNTMLRLPRSKYKYLRVTVDGPVKPEDVTGAASEVRQEQKPVWRDVAQAAGQKQQGRDTIIEFSLPVNVPVERVLFEIDPAQPNFRRDVEIEDGNTRTLGSGEINRIHMVRAGRKIDSEQQQVNLYAAGQSTLKVVVHNGDDPPPKITGARLQQHERRLYFDPSGPGALSLYYGDDKLSNPVYDYSKLFQEEKNPGAAQLGPELANAAYTGRPDDRPWSERHPAVLWGAIIAAVLVLGLLALRSSLWNPDRREGPLSP